MLLEHEPVMQQRVLNAFAIQNEGVYVDATFGRGGHTAALLKQMGDKGRLYAIDRDPEAVMSAGKQFAGESRFSIRQGSFEMLADFCNDWGIVGRVNGLLMDLGVSSPQLDDPERGFSFQRSGQLDMRMDNSQGISAKQWLARADEKEIADVLWRYGEERYARRIAKKIVAVRNEKPIDTTDELVSIIVSASPRVERFKHPATRCFQAIRIFINQELEALQSVLPQAVQVLAPAGRLVVISFHSLEDRIVKRFMRTGVKGPELPRHLPVKESERGATLRLIGKAQKAEADEVKSNPRARSAMLRVAEKLA